MANRRHFWSIILWCSISFQNSCHSQGYYYKHSNVSQYHIINGNYQHIPEKPSTTPEPTLLETIFPWKGGYDSVRTPEEDAAILSSISDHEPAASETAATTVDANGNSGIFSWLPSFPSFGSSSSSSSQNTENPQYPNPIQFPGGMYDGGNNAISGNFQNPPGPGAHHLMQDGSNNAMNGNFQNPPVPGAGLYFPPQQQHEFQPMGLSHFPPPPPPENHQIIPVINGPPPPPPQHYQQMPPMQQIPYEVRNNLQPTFQFHQQMKEAVPVPTPSINSLQAPMMPYPYSSGGNPDYGKGGTNEKSTSFFDMLSNYFTFGKRSDLDILQPQNPRSYISMAMTDREDKVKDDENVDAESDSKETEPSGGDVSSSSPPDANSNKAEFPCPKSGIWRWNGDVCIAVGPVPVWACRPNDLVVSGKIAICRNKIYFSPKVIAQPNGQSNQTEN